PSRFTTAVDKIVLNRFLGLPIFLFVMYLMFLLAINIGGALQPLFDVGSVALFVHGIQWIGYTLHFPDWLTIFLAQGLGGGINTVLPLVPQIGMMYLFLSFLEDSGYMEIGRASCRERRYLYGSAQLVKKIQHSLRQTY